MNKTPPKVGQVLYSLNIGNAVLRDKKQYLTPVIVRKVGRKYFECSPKNWSQSLTKYHLSDWREVTDYSATSMLYETEQEYRDENERDFLHEFLGSLFDRFATKKLSLETLRKMRDLVTTSVS